MQKNWGAIKNNKKIKNRWNMQQQIGVPSKQNKIFFRPLPDILGSWFLECNLILTQLDEICKKKWGAIQKNKKIN